MNIQIKISIKGSKPPVWARIQADSMITVSDLHDYINELFGFDYNDAYIKLPKHLGYSLNSGTTDVLFGVFHDEFGQLTEFGPEALNDHQYMVSDFLIEPGDKGRCVTSDKQLEIKLEPLKDEYEQPVPRCVGCSRAMVPYLNSLLMDEDGTFFDDPLSNQAGAVEDLTECLSIHQLDDDEEDLAQFTVDPSDDENWFDLLRASEQFADLEPWRWLNSDQVLVLDLPNFPQRVYCCVLGQMGDEFGLVAYVGDEGLALIHRLFTNSAAAVNTPITAQVFNLSLCRRGTFPEEDRSLLYMLDHGLENRDHWPMLRVQNPGYMSWIPQGEEVFLFADIINKISALVHDYQDRIEQFPFYQDHEWFLRKYVLDEQGFEKSVDGTIEPIASKQVQLRHAEPMINAVDLQRIKKTTRQSKSWVELGGGFASFTVAQENDNRPIYPWLELAVDHINGQILLHNLALPDQFNEQAVYVRTNQDFLLKMIQETAQRPSGILVADDHLYHALFLLCEKLGIICSLSNDLPKLDQAMESLAEFLESQH
ncbi:hypothetical protein ABWW58_16300 [Sporolactobacillus sp. STCC-11]|uniref:DUF7309 domain-containing protein n=1 Tax=Sporolactobacillus caesalpiniae TaxID=3230362 RepID=UPI0033958C43